MLLRPPSRSLSRALAPLAAAVAAALAPSGASAGDAQPTGIAYAPSSPGQPALAVAVQLDGVYARVCARLPCPVLSGPGVLLAVPEEARAGLSRGQARTLTLENGRHLVRVDVPANDGKGAYVIFVAAPPAGGEAPLALYGGFTGKPQGVHGEERVTVVVEEPRSRGVRVLVGQQREDVTLCGRPALVAAHEVDPRTLELVKGASVQSLPAEERARAIRLQAVRAPADAPGSPARLLRATSASSAVDRDVASLTDGDPATSWSEAKRGEGVGEFVRLASDSEVPILGLEFQVRPTAEVPDGAAPRALYVVMDKELFAITLPEDAWATPGALHEVSFPSAVRTSCVAVVLDGARTVRGVKEPIVTLAEVRARTDFDGMSLEALGGALAGDSDRSRAAAAMLSRAGIGGVEAAIGAFDKLDPPGRLLAMGVVDGAPCEHTMPFFTARLAAGADQVKEGKSRRDPFDAGDPELHHARDRIRRCGVAAAAPLAAIVREGSQRAKIVAAQEIALAAPAEAVPVIVDALSSVDTATRVELRTALGAAAQQERARPAIAALLEPARFNALGDVAKLDFLRALGPGVAAVPGGADAVASLAAPEASFRTRYLLLGPASELVRAREPRASTWLVSALRKDADPRIRARAAEASADAPVMRAVLVAAIDDDAVRVREAAIAAAARGTRAGVPAPKGLAAALLRRLTSDPWTFVRAGAAHALAVMPADKTVDTALATAIRDPSPDVRAAILDALGARRATAHVELVRDLAEKPEEATEVRARAMLALSAMCDRESVDVLTKLAGRAVSAADERDHRLGTAALAALGDLKPPDLEKRLEPLLGKKIPHALRERARAALAAPGTCR